MADLVAAPSLKEFFKLLLDDALNRQGLALAEITESYVVNLLSEFATAEKLFTEEGDGGKDHEPLALLYHRAQQQDRETKIRLLRRLGDISLYKAGFFSDALRDAVVGPDYYIAMGGTAYGQVASLSGSSFAGVYQELHDKFRPLVDLLEEIAARGMVANGPAGALRVFESWVRTGSGHLQEVLVDAGMLTPKSRLPN